MLNLRESADLGLDGSGWVPQETHPNPGNVMVLVMLVCHIDLVSAGLLRRLAGDIPRGTRQRSFEPSWQAKA